MINGDYVLDESAGKDYALTITDTKFLPIRFIVWLNENIYMEKLSQPPTVTRYKEWGYFFTNNEHDSTDFNLSDFSAATLFVMAKNSYGLKTENIESKSINFSKTIDTDDITTIIVIAESGKQVKLKNRTTNDEISLLSNPNSTNDIYTTYAESTPEHLCTVYYYTFSKPLSKGTYEYTITIN